MKWLIIGTSKISAAFIKALRHNRETALGVLSRSKMKGQKFAKKHRLPKFITNLNDLDDYDCVYIASPNTIHYEQAKQAIEQGKHVLVEKPMTHSYQKTQELFTLGAKHQVKVMEAYAHIKHD